MRVFTTFLLIFIAGALFTLSFYSKKEAETNVEDGSPAKVEAEKPTEDETIEESVDAVLQNAQDSANNALEVVKEKTAEVKAEAEESVDAVVEEVQKIQEETKEALNESTEEVDAVAKEAEEKAKETIPAE